MRRNNPACAPLRPVAVGPNERSDIRDALLIALIIILYLVGVGVVLSPIIRSTWNTEPASVLTDHIGQALPEALAWPVRAVHAVTGS